jgi:hypothetical protein
MVHKRKHSRTRKHRVRHTRKGGRRMRTAKHSRGLFGTVFVPVNQALGVVDNASRIVTNTTRNVLHSGISGVRNLGRNITNRADKTVRNMLGKRRKH